MSLKAVCVHETVTNIKPKLLLLTKVSHRDIHPDEKAGEPHTGGQ